jgi:hypothetical protein
MDRLSDDAPGLSLTDGEKAQLKAMIDAGRPLPQRYRTLLFAQPHEAELVWPGKTHEVTNVVLPFQSIEQIDEPRAGTQAGTADLLAVDEQTGRQMGGWTNKLIWGTTSSSWRLSRTAHSVEKPRPLMG